MSNVTLRWSGAHALALKFRVHINTGDQECMNERRKGKRRRE